MPRYIFTTPTEMDYLPSDGHPLFSSIQIPHGITVLKVNGVYRQVRYPSAEEYDGADVRYLGGGKYEVDATEKAALEAAGYTVDTIV